MVSYCIRRNGELIGPFATYDDLVPYLKAGDEIVRFNEHGNVIEYEG